MTASKAKKCAASALGPLFLAAACAGGRPSEEEVKLVPAAAPAERIYAVDAVHEIATFVCDREQRCGHIGQSSHFQQLDECLETLRLEAGAELYRCRDGVVEPRLRYCKGEIAAADCTGSDALSRYPACTAAKLCW